MSVVVATAYMEEAQRFDWLVAMDDGKILATGTPQELLARTGAANLDAAFVALLPERDVPVTTRWSYRPDPTRGGRTSPSKPNT